MSELQAGQTLNVARADAKSTRYRDALIALAAFIILALLPALTSSKFLLDFVIRCAAYGLFATSLNLLVGYTGLTSFGHGMIVAGDASTFGYPEIDVGLIPAIHFVQLPRLVGKHQAFGPLFLGDPFDAATAFRMTRKAGLLRR